MAIPEFRADGWLPEGHHAASMDEVEVRFGGSSGSQRATVMAKFKAWTAALKRKGITGMLVLDGGFISSKENPKDFDVLLVYDDSLEETMQSDAEAAALINYATCKEHGFDVFAFARTSLDAPRVLLAHPLEIWDLDGTTKSRKGVLEVQL